jgi:hypothetical protein
MVDSGVKVLLVTHLYDLAHSLHARHDTTHLLLRAERHPNGVRTFQLSPGEPEPTSYAQDTFRHIFGTTAGDRATNADF